MFYAGAEGGGPGGGDLPPLKFQMFCYPHPTKKKKKKKTTTTTTKTTIKWIYVIFPTFLVVVDFYS